MLTVSTGSSNFVQSMLFHLSQEIMIWTKHTCIIVVCHNYSYFGLLSHSTTQILAAFIITHFRQLGYIILQFYNLILSVSVSSKLLFSFSIASIIINNTFHTTQINTRWIYCFLSHFALLIFHSHVTTLTYWFKHET